MFVTRNHTRPYVHETHVFLNNKKFLFFNSKDVIFYKYICKMYKFYNDLQLKIVENQDLYRNKDDVRLFF